MPLSKTMEEDIGRLRKWAEGRARNASIAAAPDAVETRRKIEL